MNRILSRSTWTLVISALLVSTILHAGSTRTARVTFPRDPELRADDLKSMVSYLASDELEGRLTGTEGTRRASEYIAAYFRSLGLEPAGNNGTYFQKFLFTAGLEVVPEQNRLIMERTDTGRKTVYTLDRDFRPLGMTASGSVEGEVVFAGYGLVVPGKPGQGYDSYADLDVRDRIVLVLRYAPEKVTIQRRQELNLYAGLRYKAMLARERGARALLVVTGPNSPNAGELVPLRFDNSLADSGIVAVSISGRVARDLLRAAGKDLKEVQDQLDVENPHYPGSFPVPHVRLRVATGVRRIKKPDRNVLALLLPAPGVENPEFIMVGAHYDHIGRGVIGSLAHKGEEGQIHNGADDNASGTAVVMELAGYFARLRQEHPERFRRGILFALWSGEELGIIGSSYFVDHPTVPLDRIVAYINFDMVGRLRNRRLMVQGVGSSHLWPELVRSLPGADTFDMVLQEDPYLPTDVTAFYPRKIPVVSFFTGSHGDYNRPTDDPETLNYEGMERIARLAAHLVLDLVQRSQRPDYVAVQRSNPGPGARATLRAYLGTVPDYAAEGVQGVKISGVRAGSPADHAGLQSGDIIIELAGLKITNIYDYTYALGAVRIGEPVTMVVLRDGKRVELTVVPEARK